jgi:membrane protein
VRGLVSAVGRLLRWIGGRLAALARWVVANIYWRRIKALWRIAKSSVRNYWADDGDALAGYIAYATFLSMFPFAIFAVAFAGALVTPEEIDAAVDALFGLAPDHIARTLEPVIRGVALENGRTLITTAALFALWTASNAVEALRVAFDRAYRPERERGFAMRRLRAMAFVILASLTFLLLGLLIVAAPLALKMAEAQLGVATPVGVGLLRYAIGLAMFAAFLMQMHLFLPSQRPHRKRLWPGIWVSVGLWALGATAFSAYLAYAPNLAVTYGTFAGVIVTLLFFYLTGAAIIVGAEVNATLMAFRHARRSPRVRPTV